MLTYEKIHTHMFLKDERLMLGCLDDKYPLTHRQICHQQFVYRTKVSNY